jgi:hypothetical protein
LDAFRKESENMGRKTVVFVLAVVAGVSLTATGFAPSHHLSLTLGALEGAGFSEGQAWMLAYFDIEVDLATEIPDTLCQFPLRWPTLDYVCPYAGRISSGNDPCGTAGGFFDDWCEHCIPFHCPGVNSAYGISEVIQQWSLVSMDGAMHPVSGERTYDWLQRVGHMLHAMQDFYSHSTWIEAFHLNLGFEFNEIPSWTTFMKSQRGGKMNLVLLEHAGGDTAEATRLYDLLDQNLKVENHGLYNKDSIDSNSYTSEDQDLHEDAHGHTIVDFHKAAYAVAGADTYQVGLQIRANIVNNPQLGAAKWDTFFHCVEEMAAYDGKTYQDELDTYQTAVWRLKTYADVLAIWE